MLGRINEIKLTLYVGLFNLLFHKYWASKSILCGPCIVVTGLSGEMVETAYGGRRLRLISGRPASLAIERIILTAASSRLLWPNNTIFINTGAPVAASCYVRYLELTRELPSALGCASRSTCRDTQSRTNHVLLYVFGNSQFDPLDQAPSRKIQQPPVPDNPIHRRRRTIFRSSLVYMGYLPIPPMYRSRHKIRPLLSPHHTKSIQCLTGSAKYIQSPCFVDRCDLYKPNGLGREGASGCADGKHIPQRSSGDCMAGSEMS